MTEGRGQTVNGRSSDIPLNLLPATFRHLLIRYDCECVYKDNQ
jgi:hypothetical protein